MIVLFAFLHHLAAFTLVAMLTVELVLIRQELTLANARKLQAIDGVYGAAAGVLFLVGGLRVLFFEKGTAYYFSSHAFLGKFTLFILIGLISLIPTFEFLRWRKATAQGQAPTVEPARLKRLRLIIHIELGGIVLILLFAAVMAKGGWI